VKHSESNLNSVLPYFGRALPAVGLFILAIFFVQFLAQETGDPSLVWYIGVSLVLLTLTQFVILFIEDRRGKIALAISTGIYKASKFASKLIPPREYIILESGRKAKYAIYLYYVFKKGGGEKLANLMADFIKSSNVRPDYIVGHLTIFEGAGEHHKDYGLVSSVAHKLGKPYAICHEFRDEGNRMILNGDIGPGKALILDDVTTTGETIKKTVDFLKKQEQAITTDSAFVFVVRQKNAVANLKQIGVKLHYIITSEQLLKQLHARKFISDEEYAEARSDCDFQPETRTSS